MKIKAIQQTGTLLEFESETNKAIDALHDTGAHIVTMNVFFDAGAHSVVIVYITKEAANKIEARQRFLNGT